MFLSDVRDSICVSRFLANSIRRPMMKNAPNVRRFAICAVQIGVSDWRRVVFRMFEIRYVFLFD